MRGADVIQIVRLIESQHIGIWVDGGWAVDALLGRQTRAHKDLDVVINDSDTLRLRETMAAEGFHELEGGRPFNFVLADPRGQELDVHTMVIDSDGNGLYGPQPESGVGKMFPAGSLTGTGFINGESVMCVTAEYLFVTHTGYELHESDFHDIHALHRAFGIALPDEYLNHGEPTPGLFP